MITSPDDSMEFSPEKDNNDDQNNDEDNDDIHQEDYDDDIHQQEDYDDQDNFTWWFHASLSRGGPSVS